MHSNMLALLLITSHTFLKKPQLTCSYLGCKNIFIGINSTVSILILQSFHCKNPAASYKNMTPQFAVTVAQKTSN